MKYFLLLLLLLPVVIGAGRCNQYECYTVQNYSLTDNSGYGDNIVIVSPSGGAYYVNESIYTNGTLGDYFRIDANPVGDNQVHITTSLWMKVDSYSQNNQIYYRLFGNSLYPRAWIRTTGCAVSNPCIQAQYRIDGTTRGETLGQGLSSTHPLGSWVHILTVWNSTKGARHYIDGILDTNSTATGTNYDGGTNDPLFGYDSNINYDSLGAKRDIRIWNTTLTDEEAMQVFLEMPDVKCDNLIGWYPMKYNKQSTPCDVVSYTKSSYCGTGGCALVANYSLTDHSGNGHDLTNDGAEWNSSLFIFNASQNDYLYANDSDAFNFGTDGFFISAWAYINNTGSSDRGAIINKLESTGNQRSWGLDFYQTNLRCFSSDDGISSNLVAETFTSLGIGANQWHHYACHHNGTHLMLLVDGVVKDTLASPRIPTFDSTTPMRIGQSFEEREINGMIKDARIYNTSLSSTQINNIYLNNSVACDNLVAWYPFTYERQWC